MRLLLLSLSLSACQETLLHGLDEGQANDALSLLAEAGLEVQKQPQAGQYSLKVQGSQLPVAWRLLRAAGFPRAQRPERPQRLVMGPGEREEQRWERQAQQLEQLLQELPGVENARVLLSSKGAIANLRGTVKLIEAQRARRLLLTSSGLSKEAVLVELIPSPQLPLLPKPDNVSAIPLYLMSVALGLALSLSFFLLWRLRRLRGLQ